MSMLGSPFQLPEVNIISAQDLALFPNPSKPMRLHGLTTERKLTTQIDPDGHNNPSWNEKFVFRIDEDFLYADDSVVMIEIYASTWLRDILVGTVGVLLSNLLPRSINRTSKIRFIALQVRRPSGHPRGFSTLESTSLTPRGGACRCIRSSDPPPSGIGTRT
ncbi:hypothetical protein ACSQ67_022715 [Phaseolus vulgaris]